MRTIYHEFESLEHLLAQRLLPGGGDLPIRFVVFGGTGAVGGATVLELCQLILASPRYRSRPLRGEVYATGLSEKEIAGFVGRLRMAFGDQAEVEEVKPLSHYRVGGVIDLHFSILLLSLPRDLREHVLAAKASQGDDFQPEAVMAAYFKDQPRPFQEFVESLNPDEKLLHAVVVSIPLPSVATYTMEVIDGLADELGLDHRRAQLIKTSYLKTFIRGLATIQQRYARHVVMAHTTAVGGMYRVDGGTAEIRLGFAHSALGKKLVDKKYFADELTQLYIDHGFYVLVTAAAIGIDAVDFKVPLPLDRSVRQMLQVAIDENPENPPVDAGDLESGEIQIYPALRAARYEDGEAAWDEGLSFGSGERLIVEAAIRSGENGLFSVANCVALYNVMKVAIPEELAMVLVRFALFGPERRRGWFEDKLSYYAETENAHFALRLLENYPELNRAHFGVFAVQAYQALGSSTHQARLHELGLLMMLLRLRQFGKLFQNIPEQELVDGLDDIGSFFLHHTGRPAYQDLEKIDVATLATELGRLCEAGTAEAAGRLIGFEGDIAQGSGQEKFLTHLGQRLQRYVATITSLGIPIIYQGASGKAQILTGPYAAPLDMVVTRRGDMVRKLQRLAEKHGLTYEQARDWVVVNNGFIDLRPHALVNSAKEPGPDVAHQVACLSSGDEIAEWLDGLETGSYFTTCGLVALEYRLRRLYEQVQDRKIELGTRETWKHLFPQNLKGRHLLSPGLIETVRMYSEGLGKVTGTEALWPDWGY